MRKMTKKKKRSCAMCKPHKRGWPPRWTAKERQALVLTSQALQKGWYDL